MPIELLRDTVAVQAPSNYTVVEAIERLTLMSRKYLTSIQIGFSAILTFIITSLCRRLLKTPAALGGISCSTH